MPVNAQEKKEFSKTTVFEVTVRGRASDIQDGTSNTLMVAGVATMRVDSTAAFSGRSLPEKTPLAMTLARLCSAARTLTPIPMLQSPSALGGQINGRMMTLTYQQCNCRG